MYNFKLRKKKIMKLLNILSLFTVVLFNIQSILLSQENRQQFKDAVITIHDNFEEKYPELAQGFELINKSFQNSMLDSLLGHYPYEKISLPHGQETSVLDKTIESYEKYLSQSLKIPFCRLILSAIRNNIPLSDITEPLFAYVLSSPMLEKSIPSYINDYQQPDDDEDNLLIAATMKSNLEIVQFLIDLGFDTSKTSRKDKKAALHLAVKNNQFDLVTILLKAQSTDINQKSRYSGTALHLAVIYRRNKIIQLLLTNPDIEIDALDEHFTTPLGYAIDIENVSIVQQLINAGANINVPGLENWTPLHQAVNKDNLAIVACLLDAGADKNIYNSNNQRAFDLAETTQMRNLFRKKRKHAESISENS